MKGAERERERNTRDRSLLQFEREEEVRSKLGKKHVWKCHLDLTTVPYILTVTNHWIFCWNVFESKTFHYFFTLCHFMRSWKDICTLSVQKMAHIDHHLFMFYANLEPFNQRNTIFFLHNQLSLFVFVLLSGHILFIYFSFFLSHTMQCRTHTVPLIQWNYIACAIIFPWWFERKRTIVILWRERSYRTKQRTNCIPFICDAQ